jgi:glyoxylate reductase
MPRVFVTRHIIGDALDRLAQVAEVVVWPGADPPPPEALLDAAKRSDGLLTMISDHIDGAFLDAAPGLRVVSQLAVGYDNIDVAACSERGVLVCNTPGVLTDAVADLAFTLMLSQARRLPEADTALREGHWGLWSPTFMLGHDLRDKTLGVVGLGQIGVAIAERAKGFRMRLLYWSRSRKPEAERDLGIEYRDLPGLLRETDYLQVTVALTSETRGLIGAEQFALMKPGAVLINTARGPIVDQKALCEAIKSGHLGGAALDVFEDEPISPDDPLLMFPNVVVAPHVGSATVETRQRMAAMAVDNLIAYFQGNQPPSTVNGDRVLT